jgi:choline monooxygenase
MDVAELDALGVSRRDEHQPDQSTEIMYDFYFVDRSAASESARQRTIEINCGIVREDFGICEHTQLNYASGAYTPGPLSPRHEQSVAYFQDRVKTALLRAG